MDAGKLIGRGLAFPPRVVEGRLAWSEGDANVREAIELVLRTEPGERVMTPDFGAGLMRWLHEPNTIETHRRIEDRIADALAAWEPRVRVESVVVEADPADVGAAVATITYRLVATSATERVSVSVPLGG